MSKNILAPSSRAERFLLRVAIQLLKALKEWIAASLASCFALHSLLAMTKKGIFIYLCCLLPIIAQGDEICVTKKYVAAELPSKSDSHCHGYYGIKTNKKVIALTFDDGPDAIYTRKIIDVLSGYGIKATFFMVGENVLKHPELVIMAYSHGHVIANHTFSHKRLSILNKLAIEQEILNGNYAIFKIVGKYPLLFRPPYGACSKLLPEIVKDSGLHTIMWSSTTNDYDVLTSPEKIASEVLSLAHPGAIILLHDGGGKSRQKTVDALSSIIKELQKRGYKFVTVPELLKLEPYL
jgi:peptidoglycan/xylan/chitin deacetylase (PgdA/CDA1 family)